MSPRSLAEQAEYDAHMFAVLAKLSAEDSSVRKGLVHVFVAKRLAAIRVPFPASCAATTSPMDENRQQTRRGRRGGVARPPAAPTRDSTERALAAEAAAAASLPHNPGEKASQPLPQELWPPLPSTMPAAPRQELLTDVSASEPPAPTAIFLPPLMPAQPAIQPEQMPSVASTVTAWAPLPPAMPPKAEPPPPACPPSDVLSGEATPDGLWQTPPSRRRGRLEPRRLPLDHSQPAQPPPPPPPPVPVSPAPTTGLGKYRRKENLSAPPLASPATAAHRGLGGSTPRKQSKGKQFQQAKSTSADAILESWLDGMDDDEL